MNCARPQAAQRNICRQIPQSTVDISHRLLFIPHSHQGVCLTPLLFSEGTSICRCSCASVFVFFFLHLWWLFFSGFFFPLLFRITRLMIKEYSSPAGFQTNGAHLTIMQNITAYIKYFANCHHRFIFYLFIFQIAECDPTIWILCTLMHFRNNTKGLIFWCFYQWEIIFSHCGVQKQHT